MNGNERRPKRELVPGRRIIDHEHLMHVHGMRYECSYLDESSWNTTVVEPEDPVDQSDEKEVRSTQNSDPSPSPSLHGRQGTAVSTPKVDGNTSLGPLRILNISHIVNTENLLSNKRNVVNINVVVPIKSPCSSDEQERVSESGHEETIRSRTGKTSFSAMGRQQRRVSLDRASSCFEETPQSNEKVFEAISPHVSITNAEVTAEPKSTRGNPTPSISAVLQPTPVSRFGKSMITCRRKLNFEDTTIVVGQPVFSEDDEQESAARSRFFEEAVDYEEDDSPDPSQMDSSESEGMNENVSSVFSGVEDENCESEMLDESTHSMIGVVRNESVERKVVEENNGQSTRNCDVADSDEVEEESSNSESTETSELEEMDQSASSSYSRVEDENYGLSEPDESTHSVLGVSRSKSAGQEIVRDEATNSDCDQSTEGSSDVGLAASSSPTSSSREDDCDNSVVLEDNIDDVDESTDGNGTSANSSRKNGQKEVFGLMLEKRTIIKPDANPNGLRRSRRNRCQPLRSWLGEKAVYVDSPSGIGKRLHDVTTVIITDKLFVKYETADMKLARERELKEKSRKSKRSAKK